MANSNGILLEVRNLKMYFPITRGIVVQRHVGDIKAVDDISFQVKRERRWVWWGSPAAGNPPPDVPFCSSIVPRLGTFISKARILHN